MSPVLPARAVRPERCRYALCSAGGSTCTTSSVGVDDQTHVVDVDAAGRDVGGHEHPRLPGGERREVAVACVLRQVAVQIDGGNAGLGELTGKLAGLMLRAHEQDSPARAGGQGPHEVLLRVGVVDVEHVVRHRRDRGVRLVDRVQHLVAQEPRDELVDPVVQRGREQQALTALRCRVHDPRHAGKEAEIGHVVGLVEHGDLHRVECDELLPHQVLEPARAGDHDVHAAAQRVDLTVLRDPAEDGGHPQPGDPRKGFDDRGDLRGQLAGRGQHQSTRAARGAGGAAGQARGERDGERQRLATARAAAAEHVTAGQRVGQRVDLDRERAGDAVVVQGRHQGPGNAEVGEGNGHRYRTAFRCSVCASGTSTDRR